MEPHAKPKVRAARRPGGADSGDGAMTRSTAAEIVVVNVNDYTTSDRPAAGGGRDERPCAESCIVQLTVRLTEERRERWPRGARRASKSNAWIGPSWQRPELHRPRPSAPFCTAGPTRALLRQSTSPSCSRSGANPLYVGSDVGHASVLDSALLVSMWGAMYGMLQGASVCEGGEDPARRLLHELAQSVHTGGGRSGDRRGETDPERAISSAMR